MVPATIYKFVEHLELQDTRQQGQLLILLAPVICTSSEFYK